MHLLLALMIILPASTPLQVSGEGCFTINLGQWNERALFPSRLPGVDLWLTEEGLVSVDTESGSLVRTCIVDLSAECRVTGADRAPHLTSYFLGNDPAGWVTNVPSYCSVVYEGVRPGVDLMLRFTDGEPRFEVLCSTGAGSGVLLRHQRADSVWFSSAEDVLLPAGDRAFARMPGPSSDDPVDVVYSTYLGGSVEDRSYSIGVDGEGAAYVTGRTSSPDFRLQDPVQGSYAGGDWDAFVTKLSADGTQLVYSTFIGGSDADNGYGIKIGSDGSAYLVGPTYSADFPTQSALQPSLNGASDAFVLKLSPDGDALIYSTYMGGAGTELGRDLEVDSQGRAHIVGTTTSTDFPLQSAWQSSYGGGASDAFAFRLSFSGAQLDFSTYLGGSGAENGEGIHIDGDGRTLVTGLTASTDFPVVSAFQASYGGGDSDAFLTRLSPAGSQAQLSTFLGGSGPDYASNVSADASGMLLTGETGSADFPTLNPYQGSLSGTASAFVTRLAPGGGSLSFSTYIGGSGADQGRDICVSAGGNALVTGYTSSSDFPVVNAFQSSYAGGNNDCFVLRLTADGTGLDYSTYLGGSGNDSSRGIDLDAAGSAYVTGGIFSTDFPTVNPYQGSSGGGLTDCFVAKLSYTGTSVEEQPWLPAASLCVTGLTPNPFRTELTLGIAMPGPGRLEIAAFDLSGRRVATIHPVAEVPAGEHTFSWNPADLAPDLYLIRTVSPGWTPVAV